MHGFKTKPNVKIQNYFTKFFGEFGAVESHPVELLVDFPFPKLGQKDGTPLRAQFIPADFCKEPDLVSSNKPILPAGGGATPAPKPQLSKEAEAEAEAEIIKEAVKNFEVEAEPMPLILPDFDEVEQKKEEAENEIVEKEAENIAIAIVGAGFGEAIHVVENIDDLLEAARDDTVASDSLSTEPPLKKRKIVKKKLEQGL